MSNASALKNPEREALESLDPDAFALLLKEHEASVARQMWRFTRLRAQHVELVQDVFVEAYLSSSRYRRQSVPFGHWLSRIATRVGYRFWKQEARNRRYVPLVDMPVNLPERPEESAALLHELLGQLRPADRLVLSLMYFEDCAVKQIAERTGWNSGIVKMRAMRARRRLRHLIDSQKYANRLECYMDTLETIDCLARRARLEIFPCTNINTRALLAGIRPEAPGRWFPLAWTAAASAMIAVIVLTFALRSSTPTQVDTITPLFQSAHLEMP